MPAREGSHSLLFYVRYPYHRLRVFCPNPGCDRHGVAKPLDAYALKSRFGDISLQRLAALTRCSVCGHRPGRIFAATINDLRPTPAMQSRPP
jgi:hypothetical protein